MKANIYIIVKRVFDILSSLAAIIVSSPIWLVSAIGIKASSEGPVFFKTKRIGKDHKPFTLYKFRSMHMYDPSANGNKGGGEKSFMANENRIFKFGSFLRSSKLDELPQLINILAGNMSVIGPRPMYESGVKKFFNGENACILDVKPGLACLDSLYDYAHGELFVKDESEYKNRIFPTRTELARMYVEKRSVGLDIYCIARTLQLIFQIVVLRKKDFDYTKYEKMAIAKIENSKDVE